MMYSLDSLLGKVKAVASATPCTVHGYASLEVCVEVGCDAVRCRACNPRGCLCWDDS